ncbi:hypothetical protein PVAND_001494 [Polypedilum vanderplanki]|uniref:BTB domain-containing protein n=1 Tax=Polypedilum vanderplanki TaxID=319348 RepID=A0A9J6BN43_POLVA|nr:hypothetical protein PVAND_001494 [Polypedilum vanderplanki]
MQESFEIEIPSFSTVSGSKYFNEFHNKFGKWTTAIVSSGLFFSGNISLEPLFDATLVDLKKTEITVNYRPSDRYDGYYPSVIAENYCGTLFWFGVALQNGSGYRNSQMLIKITMPQAQYEFNKIANPKNDSVGIKIHLEKLFETGNHADITIQSNGKEFKVHKLILMRSEVFEKMLTGPTKEAQSGIIVIKDFDYDVIAEMCRFLYYDEIPKIQTLALPLMIAADKYMIDDLANKCENFLLKNITIENFHDVLVIADQLDKNILREAAIDFIIENCKIIFSSENWKNLKKNNMELAMLVTEKFMISNASKA